MQCTYHGGPMRRSPIRKIIACHRCNHHMPESEFTDTRYNVVDFGGIQGLGLPSGDVAKATVARAYVAANHESGRAVAPAFRPVRTHTRRAYGMQMPFVKQLNHLRSLEPAGQLDFKPFRLAAKTYILLFLSFHGFTKLQKYCDSEKRRTHTDRYQGMELNGKSGAFGRTYRNSQTFYLGHWSTAILLPCHRSC